MRGLVVGALALLLGACATDRSALRPVGEPAVTRGAGGSAPACVPVQRTVVARPMTARALASEMGLRYEDVRNHVLLTDEGTRVRIWKDPGDVSVPGRQVTLATRTRRQGRSLVVPASMVSYVEREVNAQRKSVRTAIAQRRPTLRLYAGGRWKRKGRPPCELRTDPVPAPVPTPAPRMDVGAPDPAWSVFRAPSRAWRWIVVHHSDDTTGNLAKYDRLHRRKGWDECGYHFVIGNGTLSGDGEVEVGTRWPKQKHGAHCKTPDNRYNDFGIGICLVGDFERGGRPSRAQLDSLVRLCRFLMARFDIPLDRLVGHSDCKPTKCPGRFFPWAQVRERLR
ncbi:MAG: N-acetylmuramoyl-L-alanine amidase [Planctomycetota bacterium]